MKEILSYTSILFICFITFSYRPQINASEVEVVRVDKSHLGKEERQAINKYGYMIYKQSQKDPEFASLTFAIIRTESNFEYAAKSYRGAIGLMQLMPSTASDMGMNMGIKIQDGDLEDPDINIKLGVSYVRYLQDKLSEIEDSDRKLILILASYNSGLHRVKHAFNCRGFECYIKRANLCDYEQFGKALSTLPEETQLYLKSVKDYYARYRKVFNVT
jgi:soluble lytic murein transglycosylase-like protein